MITIRVSPIDGQVHRVEPEFADVSSPGSRDDVVRKFASDAFPSDFSDRGRPQGSAARFLSAQAG